MPLQISASIDMRVFPKAVERLLFVFENYVDFNSNSSKNIGLLESIFVFELTRA